MLKKKSLFLLTTLICVCVFSSVLFLFNSMQTTADATIELNAPNYNSEYVLGDKIKVENATIAINGNEIEATPTFYCPNGKAYTAGEFTLDTCGEYKIEYSCKVNGETYNEYVYFSVYETLITLDNKGLSEMYYGTHPQYESLGEGVYINMSPDTVVRFNKVIDLSNATPDDEIIQLFVTPEIMSLSDISRIFIVFEDVHNPSNVVRMVGKDNVSYPAVSWWQAAAPGQEYAGGSDRGIRYGLSNMYGATGPTFRAVKQHRPPYTFSMPPISVRYDSKTQTFYHGEGAPTVSLSDPNVYNNPWKGFTTGEVRISIEIVSSKSNAKLFVTKVMGQDLSSSKIYDAEAPKITVDLAGNNENELIAKTGVKYKLFDAKAYDAQSGTRDVSVKVYKNYGTNFQTNVNIQNGSFIPKSSGKYVAVYESKDYLGNISTVCYTIQAVDNPKKPTISISNNKVDSGLVNERIKIANVEVDCIGSAIVETSVLSPSGINVINGEFFTPEQTGEFVVKYKATDYIGQTTEGEYIVTVMATEQTQFATEIIMPKYFLSGYNYTLPELIVVDYKTGVKVERLAKVDIKYVANDKTDNITSGDEYTFDPNYEGEIVLKYYDGENTSTEILFNAYAVITRNGDTILYDKYFIKENITIKQEYDYLELTSTQNTSSIAFIQKLLTNNLETSFEVENGNNITAIELCLEGAENKENKLVVRYVKNGSNVDLYINNKFVMKLLYGFNTANSLFYARFFDGKLYTETVQINLSEYIQNMDAFCYFTMKVENAQNSKILFMQLGGQYFYEGGEDLSYPAALLTNIYGGFFDINETYTINDTIIAYDVLDPNVMLELTVTDPSGAVVTSAEGVVLQNVPVGVYNINLTSYGAYSVKYYAYDSHNGFRNEFGYTVFVLDNKGPEIHIDGNVPTTYKVNEVVKLPKATITDNLALSSERVYIYVTTPNNTVIDLGENGVFKPEKTGKYKIVYWAMDAAGNISSQIFEVVVE